MRRLQWREQQEVPAGCIGFGWHNERSRALKSNMLFIKPAMQQRVQQELQHRKRMKPCSLVMCGALAAGVLSLQLMLCSWWFLLQASVPLEDVLWRAAEAGGLHELEYRDPQVARWTDITYTSWRSSSTAEENQQYSKRRYAWMSAQKLSARGGCIGNWRTVGRREYSKCMAAITTWFMDLFDATLGFPGEGPGDTLLGTFAHVRQMIDLQETYATPMSSDGEGEFVARPALEVAPTTPPNCAPPPPVDLLAVRQRLGEMIDAIASSVQEADLSKYIGCPGCAKELEETCTNYGVLCSICNQCLTPGGQVLRCSACDTHVCGECSVGLVEENATQQSAQHSGASQDRVGSALAVHAHGQFVRHKTVKPIGCKACNKLVAKGKWGQHCRSCKDFVCSAACKRTLTEYQGCRCTPSSGLPISDVNPAAQNSVELPTQTPSSPSLSTVPPDATFEE